MIRTPQYHRTSTSSIYYLQARDIAKLMLLYNFCLGVVICCLGRIYTNDFLDFASIYACLIGLSNIPVNSGEPPHNFPELQHLFHQYTPFKASFRSARRNIIFRNGYNNHCTSEPYLSSIHEKSSTSIKKSYSILLPRWTLCFVRGIFLAELF